MHRIRRVWSRTARGKQPEDISRAYQASPLESFSCLRIWTSSSVTAQWNEVVAVVSLTSRIHTSFSPRPYNSKLQVWGKIRMTCRIIGKQFKLKQLVRVKQDEGRSILFKVWTVETKKWKFLCQQFFGRHRKTSRNNPHRNVVLTRLYSRWHAHSQNPCRCGSLKTSLRLRFWFQNSKIKSSSVRRRKLKTAKKLLVRQKDESNYTIDRQLANL